MPNCHSAMSDFMEVAQKLNAVHGLLLEKQIVTIFKLLGVKL